MGSRTGRVLERTPFVFFVACCPLCGPCPCTACHGHSFSSLLYIRSDVSLLTAVSWSRSATKGQQPEPEIVSPFAGSRLPWSLWSARLHGAAAAAAPLVGQRPPWSAAAGLLRCGQFISEMSPNRKSWRKTTRRYERVRGSFVRTRASKTLACRVGPG